MEEPFPHPPAYQYEIADCRSVRNQSNRGVLDHLHRTAETPSIGYSLLDADNPAAMTEAVFEEIFKKLKKLKSLDMVQPNLSSIDLSKGSFIVQIRSVSVMNDASFL